MSFKKLLFVMLVIIVGMFGLMLTTSYAWYSFENSKTNFEAITKNDDILVSYQSGEYISTAIAIPITDEQVDKYSEKSNFNIRVDNNNGKNEVMISVSLTEVMIDDALKNNNFKIDLYYQGRKLNEVIGTDIVTGTDIVLSDVLLDSDLTNMFEIRVYILDDGTDQGMMMEKSFKAKIKIDVLARLKTSFVDYDANPDIYISSITVDGEVVDYIPASGYYNLSDYSCDKGSVLSWDSLSKTITYDSGASIQDVCSLSFTTSNDYPKLNTMPVGSYVKYVGKGGNVGTSHVSCQKGGNSSSAVEGDATEAPNSCLGQNAREDIDNNKNTYGYCGSANYKYHTTGWRVAYIDLDGKPVIISAGSPECNVRTLSVGNEAYIQFANSKALKYCNSDYVDGDCSCIDDNNDGLCDSASSDAWAISNMDFNMMTAQMTNTSGGYLFNYIENAIQCGGVFSRQECGYNNNLIDNGGYYWFSARYSSNSEEGIYWNPNRRIVDNTSNQLVYGLRPMISLSSSIVVTSGSGTMEDPYIISKK